MSRRPDRVRQYLRRRGCPPSIVEGGLEGLLAHWESLVDAVAEGYDLTLADYRHDMELRDVLAGALDAAADERAPAQRRLAGLDARFRELTVACGPVIADEPAIGDEPMDPVEQWWYFRRPKAPGPDFEEELREADLV